jgi:translocator protein
MLPAPWPAIVVCFVSLAIVGAGGRVLTEVGPWYENLKFPSWRPPNWLFAPVWTIIYFFVGLGAVICWYSIASNSLRAGFIILFAINAVLNILWSGLFFKYRRPDWALVEVIVLWLSIVLLLVFTWSCSTLAGALILPYLAWVTFAAYLNLRMVQLNAPFQEKE